MIPATSSWMDNTCNDQDGPWWGNFGEQADNTNNQYYCSKMALSSLQNQSNSSNNPTNNNGLSWEGDLNNLFYGGYIF